MLFYIALAIACVIAATVCLWLFRSMVEVGKTAYRALLPSARSEYRQVKLAQLNSNLQETPSPWGWSRNGDYRTSRTAKWKDFAHRPEAESRKKVPWGWPGSEGLKRSNLELISEGLENSAAVASVKSMLSRPERQKDEERPVVGWPYREESFEFSGRKYKVRSKDSRKLGRVAKAGKPWGW